MPRKLQALFSGHGVCRPTVRGFGPKHSPILGFRQPYTHVAQFPRDLRSWDYLSSSAPHSKFFRSGTADVIYAPGGDGGTSLGQSVWVLTGRKVKSKRYKKILALMTSAGDRVNCSVALTVTVAFVIRAERFWILKAEYSVRCKTIRIAVGLTIDTRLSYVYRDISWLSSSERNN